MKRILLLFIAVISFTTFSNAQTALDLYTKIYKTSDSLKKKGKLSAIDTVSLYKEIVKLEKAHPKGYFEASKKYMQKLKLNEAAFVYYLGMMRYGYYSSATPKQSAEKDNSFNSLRINTGQPVNLFLQTDVDNFLFIFKKLVNYYKHHDYAFYPKKNSIEKYNAQITSYKATIAQVEKDKVKFKGVWESDRKVMESNIEEAKAKQKETHKKK